METLEKILTWIVIFMVSTALGAFLNGWLIMLLVGMLHEWDSVIPTMGYWVAVPIGIVYSCLTYQSPKNKS